MTYNMPTRQVFPYLVAHPKLITIVANTKVKQKWVLKWGS